PVTRPSMVAQLGGADPIARARACDLFVRAYARPIYAHLRRRWRRQREEAEDLTQDFLIEVLERCALRAFDPERSHFRSFVRLCLDRFASNRTRDERRLKRGGGMRRLRIDVDAEERALELSTGETADPEAVFDRAWVQNVLKLARDRLE